MPGAIAFSDTPLPHGAVAYTARSQFVAFHNRKQRFAAGVAHRRAGKTVASIVDMIWDALENKRERPRYAYFAPLRQQAKDVAWSYLKFYGEAAGGTAYEYELRVDFPNGARVRLYGADNPDALRGLYLDGAVLDEYAQMRPQLWSEVIRPALSDREGWAVFIGTPAGKNAFYDLINGTDDGKWVGAKKDPDWFYFEMKASDTHILSDDELASAKQSMTDAEYAQEYECSFEAAIIGSYYGELIGVAEADKRIGFFPYDPAALVTTAWDLGWRDDTVIWFAQIIGQEIRLIDYYENRGADIAHYAQIVLSKPYAYHAHIYPHDGAKGELIAGTTVIAQMKSLLGRAVGDALPRISVQDGINAARVMLPKCTFDASRCAVGLKALRLYRHEYDDTRKVFSDKPLHDWTSHAADAFRYLAMGLKDAMPERKRQERGAPEGAWMS